MSEAPLYEAAEREALAARIRVPDETEHLPGLAPSAEEYVRAAYEQALDQLQTLRTKRDELNAQIKVAVAEEELLNRAVAVFDRAAKHD